MRDPSLVIILLASVLITSCGAIDTVIIAGTPEDVERNRNFYTTVKTCRSKNTNVTIGIRPPVINVEEIWTRDTARIEIQVQGELDGYNYVIPLTLVWEHTLAPGELRTFTDLPTFIETSGLLHKFSRSRMEKTFRKFLSELRVNRPITRLTLTTFIPNYLTLIESCLYP